MLNGLDLFSGIGGISLALEPWVKTIAYCEIERYCQAVLLSRMSEGKITLAPIWDDVRTLSKHNFDKRIKIDLISAGFPCQDISVAGLGAGLAGKRSGLFFEIVRLTREINPTFVFIENVPAIRTRGLREVIRAFTDLRYDCRWTCVSAKEVGACHIRKRWFLLAYSNSKRQSNHVSGRFAAEYAVARDNFNRDWWTVEPDVGRVANGIPNRVDRIKGLGNAVVPYQAEEAFKRLMNLETKPKDQT